MEEDKMLILIGFAIVVVVALNIAMVFGDMFSLGGGLQMISGFAVADCKTTVGGVACGGTTYEVKVQDTSCPNDLVPICTNACELGKAQANDNRICPTYCTDFCLPVKIAENVLNAKSNNL